MDWGSLLYLANNSIFVTLRQSVFPLYQHLNLNRKDLHFDLSTTNTHGSHDCVDSRSLPWTINTTHHGFPMAIKQCFVKTNFTLSSCEHQTGKMHRGFVSWEYSFLLKSLYLCFYYLIRKMI